MSKNHELITESTKLQAELSQKVLSNSTFESLNQLSPLSSVVEKPAEMFSRRLKGKRHPLSGMKTLIPELSQSFETNPNNFTEELSNTYNMNSRILEIWINNTISDAASLNLPGQVIKAESKAPLMRYGVDRTALLKAGLQKPEIDRLYRSLFVYSIGFYQLIQKILEHTNKKYPIVTGIWKVYAILLEYCCQLDYQMIITTLNLEKREEIIRLESEFHHQIAKLENNEKELTDNIEATKAEMLEVQKELRVEVMKREDIEDELNRRGTGYEDEVAMRLQFEKRLNQMYAKLRDLQAKIILMNERLADLTKESEARGESLQKEKAKNSLLSKAKYEVEKDARKAEEKSKQTENVNSSLEKRLEDCYIQIEMLNTALSNLNSSHSEKINEVVQKKIEIDDLRFTLEVTKTRLEKVDAYIIEFEENKKVQISRIKELEFDLAEQAINNQHYKQEYVKIKEAAKLSAAEVERLSKLCKELEVKEAKLIEERDLLSINLSGMTTLANELKINLKDTLMKIAEMAKGRKILEDENNEFRAHSEEKAKELKDAKAAVIRLKAELDEIKNIDIENKTEITNMKIKLKNLETQLISSTEAFEGKISNLEEIKASEILMRNTWIQRFEAEQKAHSTSKAGLLIAHEKINENLLKISTLQSTLEQHIFQNSRLTQSYKENFEEILLLRSQIEEANKKTRAIHSVLEKTIDEFKQKEHEFTNTLKRLNDDHTQQINQHLMKVEDVSACALNNLKDCQSLLLLIDSYEKSIASLTSKLSSLPTQLERKSELSEKYQLYSEELISVLISDENKFLAMRLKISELDRALIESRKELLNFKSMAPMEIRALPNPFQALMVRIKVLENQLAKPELFVDAAVQGGFEQYDVSTQTDLLASDRSEVKSRSSGFSKRSAGINGDSQVLRKDSILSSAYLSVERPSSRLTRKNIEESEIFEEEKLADSAFLSHTSKRSSLKKFFTKENSLEPSRPPSKSSNKLPFISNRSHAQPSPLLATPVLPSDFKRAFKQAISRKNHTKLFS